MSTDLALPTVDELKNAFHTALSEAAVGMLADYVQLAQSSDDVEDKRKFMSWASETLGWKRQAPKSENDNLPVFNFNFGSGNVQMTAISQDGTQTQVEFTATPTPTMSAATFINDDVLDD
jgi:hypothetical protein